MIQTTESRWLMSLQPGDVGLIKGDGFFASLQNLYRQKFHEGDMVATHGFMMETSPNIVESNGLFVSRGQIIKNIGNSKKVWIFRNKFMNPGKYHDMEIYADAAVQAGGHYGIGSIVQFGAQYLGIRKKLSDSSGEFCTELCTHMLMEGDLPVPEDPPWQVTPSYLLNWMSGTVPDKSEEKQGPRQGWFLAANYDGNKVYSISN
jgi:hypothetical protein